MKIYFKAFKNDAKKEGDTRPIFSNSNVVVKEKITFDPNEVYSLGFGKITMALFVSRLNWKMNNLSKDPTYNKKNVELKVA